MMCEDGCANPAYHPHTAQVSSGGPGQASWDWVVKSALRVQDDVGSLSSWNSLWS